MHENEVEAKAQNLHEYNENEIYRHPNGNVECKLCLTYHTDLNNFLTHAQGKRHRSIAKKEVNKSVEYTNSSFLKYKKIGIPQYNVTKIRDSETSQLGLRIELHLKEESLENYPDPQFKILGSYEQSIEPVNTKYQRTQLRSYNGKPEHSFRAKAQFFLIKPFEKFWTGQSVFVRGRSRSYGPAEVERLQPDSDL
ncbi:hypothetical protein FF38_09208 [Lucilia cuprina]|uniref:Uncharacterized protein n=1 Tax=Lucilia cuprina TaxID=7375 RepID=A0A0L0BYY1_LUCCU|nr:hypothetical protein FF38_09208 [Lucilia cuprina]